MYFINYDTSISLNLLMVVEFWTTSCLEFVRVSMSEFQWLFSTDIHKVIMVTINLFIVEHNLRETRDRCRRGSILFTRKFNTSVDAATVDNSDTCQWTQRSTLNINFPVSEHPRLLRHGR